MATANTVTPTNSADASRRTNFVAWIAGAVILATAAIAAIALLNMPVDWLSNDKGRALKALPESMLSVVLGRSAAQQRINEAVATTKANCAGTVNPEACFMAKLKTGESTFRAKVAAGTATEADKEKLEIIKSMIAGREQ